MVNGGIVKGYTVFGNREEQIGCEVLKRFLSFNQFEAATCTGAAS